jgi:hypothetical protein
MKMMNRILIAIGTLLLSHAAAAQIVECVDAKGNKTMAQFCPPGTVKETQLRKDGTGSSTSAPGPASAGKSVAERDAELRNAISNVKRPRARPKRPRRKVLPINKTATRLAVS